MDRVENIAKEMRNIELYNAMSINNLEKTKKKWIKINLPLPPSRAEGEYVLRVFVPITRP